jgi:hypothetical protein
MNLAMTNAVHKSCLPPTLAFGNQVMCVALRRRYGAAAERALH